MTNNSETANNKRIAKNTLFLYFRMLLTMAITLYTSRVILDVLGVDDYGIYQSVCGIVIFLSFLNSALATGSSRFITFELGKKVEQQLSVVFSTILIIHIILAVGIFIFGEGIGLWFIKNKLIIPPERIPAAIFAFHFSMLTALFTITQVPYNSLIIAHEQMDVYAYVSILEVVLKLTIVYVLKLGNFDRLEFYSVLLFSITMIILLIYRLYCRLKFSEAKFHLKFDRKIFKSIAAFSSWSLLSSASIAVANQGVTVVTNMFFAPAIVAARSLALQANDAINKFISNFRTAVNPQIVKKYASTDYEGSKKLLLDSTRFSYYLMWIIVLPLSLLTKPVLKLWLGNIPEYTVIFLKIIIVQSLFQVFDSSFYTALYAKGQLRENAIWSSLCGFLQLPVVYVLFKMNFSPVCLSWVSLVCSSIPGILIKPILLCRIVNYSKEEILNIFWSCIKVTVFSIIMPLVSSFFFNNETVFGFIMIFLVSILSVLTTVYFIGLDKVTRSVITKRVFHILRK
jgi:O-antigen/teichoic acid export membrane protein